MNGLNNSISIIAIPPRVSGMFKIALKELDMLLEHNYNANLITTSKDDLYYVIKNYDDIMKNKNYKTKIFLLNRYESKISFMLSNKYKISYPIVSEFLNLHRYTFSNKVYKILKDNNTKFVLCHTSLSCIIFLNNISFYEKYHIIPYIHSYLISDYAYNVGFKNFSKPLFSIEKHILNKSSHLIANTKRIKNYLIGKGFRGKNISVLYPSAFSLGRLDEQYRSKWIVTLTRWDVDRKISFYIKLANMFKKERINYKLVLLGNWPDKNLLLRFLRDISKQELRQYIGLLLDVNEYNLYKILQKSKIFIFAENAVFGMGALEAAAQGTPIVVSKNSGIWEIFEHGVHGYKANINDVEDFFRGLLKIDANWVSYSINIYTQAKKYNWGNHLRNLIKILNNLQ